MKVKHIIIFINIVFILVISGCTSTNETIIDEVKMNDSVSIYLEVNTEFIDPGVSMPENYTLISNNNVDMNRIGSYQVKYQVLDDEGVTVKEMTRVVNVIDTTGPNIKLKDSQKPYYFGQSDMFDYVMSVEDNYCDSLEIIFSHNLDEVNPNQNEGIYTITFTAEDTEGNISSEEIEITFIATKIYDLVEKLVNENDPIVQDGYQNDYPSGKLYYWINLKEDNSISVDEDDSITFRYSIDTPYGEGFVGISSEYGQFHNATVYIHIGSGIDNYTTAFVHGYNATSIDLETVIVFDSYSINYLNIPKSEAESYLNMNIKNAINAFVEFIEKELDVLFK